MTAYYPSNIRCIFDPEKGLYQEVGEPSTITFASGTIVEISGVVAYAPEDPTQWSTVPTNLIQAVDYLAAGSGSGGGGGGSAPGGANGDIQYKLNATTFGGVNKIRFVGGNVFVTGSFLGDLAGTASYATNAGNSLTASYVLNAVSSSFATSALTASYVLNAVSSSFATSALTASYVLNAVSASFATNSLTASFVQNAVSSSFATSALTASYVLNAVSSSFASTALSASYAANAKFSWQQAVFVSKNGNDSTADGSLNNPFLTISGAMASINDASPTKRYIINVNPGTYTETGVFQLKANVYINGFDKNTVRISPTSFAMNPDFSGGAGVDNRSGFSNCTLIGNCDFNWTTVTSSAGKLYFQNCSFNNNVSFTGYNNAIAQIGTYNCLFFGSWTISGINAGTHQGNIHGGAVVLNQHPSLPTILNANGGSATTTTVTTTVNNFSRRCACFFYSFWAGSLTIDGPSSYVDATQSSLDTAGPTILNGGTFVPIGNVVNSTLSNLTNPTSINANLVPDTTSTRYNGDFGKQWLFNFAYVYGSTGTEMYLITMPSVFGSSDTGRDIWLLPDGYGLNTNVNGGNIILETAATTGTGSRGAIILNARQIDASGSLMRNLGTPLTGSDAATAKYADVFPTGSTASRPTGPVTGQRFFDTTIGRPIWWNGTNWINAAGTIV